MGDEHLATELFADFPDNRAGRIFPWLDFTSWEFPLERQVFVGRPLGKEDATLVLYYSANNGNRRRHRLLNKQQGERATFLTLQGSFAMKTAFKIILVVAILLVAIKLSPIVFVLALGGLLVAAVLGAVGLSLLAAFTILVFALAAALSPIWIPVLAIVGLVALLKKLNEPSPAPKIVA